MPRPLPTGAGEEAFRAAFEVDLMHTRNACEAALPWLERSGAGSIIAISSISGSEDYGYDSVSYGTMKAALFFYVKSLARHVAPKGIRANVVSPGTTLFDGGFWDRVRINDPKSFEANVAANPIGRMATAGGDRRCGGVPRQPARQLHLRHQPGGGRHADHAGAGVVSEA